MHDYLIKFRSSFMPEGKWSASTVQAPDLISAKEIFWERIRTSWGQDMVQHIGLISCSLISQSGE